MNRWQNILYWLSTLTIIIVGFGGAALVLMTHHERNPSFWYEYLFLALINTAPLQVWLAARWQQQLLTSSAGVLSIILLGLSWWQCWKQLRS